MFMRHWMPTNHNGQTVLLIHGLASSSVTWLRLASYLKSNGYEVYAPDLSGHGKSSWKSSYSVQDWTDEILETNVEPDIIIGHSIGGLIAANLSQSFSAAKTVLLDPVFHLPRSSFVLGWVHFFFSRQLRTSKPKSNAHRHQLVEHSSMRKWDAKSISALAAPHDIARSFTSVSRDALMIRAGRSYIFPAIKSSAVGILFEHYLKVGHNIHVDAFDRFVESLSQFLSRPSALA